MGLGNIRLYSTFAIVIVALIIIALERVFPFVKNQKLFREGFFQDFVLYTLVQSFVLGIAISYIIEFINNSTSLSTLNFISSWPIWVQVLFFLFTHDFYIYCFHRYQHKSKIFWRIHEAHHSNREIDWLAGSRSHALEILINQTIEFTPIVLLGAAPQVAVIKGFIDAAWGMYIHSNIDVHMGWLQYFINGPEMHRWHHADEDSDSINKNFATKFAVWDWIFGTAYFPKNKRPRIFGLSYLNFPKSYFKQLIFAFRKFTNE
jgi:sterol desaturase/sphingolipid hydroxylase (fatty acid hydroxylase superfamily)